MVCKAKNSGPAGSHPAEVITQDENNRFVTDAQIEQWTNGVIGLSTFMSLVFMRTSTVPDTPVGGSFQFPIPDGGLWTNVPLPGIDPLFISTRVFTSTGEFPQQTAWSAPSLFVQNGSIGDTGEQGIPGDNGIQGIPGQDGSNGVNGDDGTSIVWLGEAASHPINPENGHSYKNTTDGKSYIYWDAWYQMTIDGFDGQDGLDIVWKGDHTVAPSPAEVNWAYRDTDNGLVYICTIAGTPGTWELMIQDKNDGVDGTNGTDGLSVYITYHDGPITGTPPVPPTNAAGDNNGWHTAVTDAVNWMSQKVDDGTGIGWSLAIQIKGINGTVGVRGSNTFTLDESDAGTTYITAATASIWGAVLTDVEAQNVARDIINTFSPDGYLRPNDKITITDNNSQVSGTRVYYGTELGDFGLIPTEITASDFGSLVTETIDGNLLINGSVSVDRLGSDVVSAGLINTTLLTGAVIQTSESYTVNGKVLMSGAENGLVVYDTNGAVRVRIGKLS